MRWVHYIAVDKQGWLNFILTMIETLNGQFHFYWSGLCHHIKDLDTLIKKKKDFYRGKMVLYYDDYMYYFVVYCKNKIDVYKLVDRYCDTPGKQSYFIKKWKKHYKCLDELE